MTVNAPQDPSRSAGATPVGELSLERIDAIARAWWPLVALVSAVFFVNSPVLGNYFFGDDFVPLADVASRSTPSYLKALFLQQDATPNWRFLTGVFYLAAFRAFELNALPYLLATVALHTATAALLFLLVRRLTESTGTALLAGGFFGLSAAPVPTVGQVTAINNVIAGFFIVLSLLTLCEGLARGRLRWWRLRWWLGTSVLAFTAAIAANESAAVLAPVPALLLLWRRSDSAGWWREPREWLATAACAAPYAVVGGAALIGFAACGCTEASGIWGSGDHLFTNLLVFLGRLLYPLGMEVPGDVGPAHAAGGGAVLGVAAIALARGPATARFAVAFLALTLAPHLPILNFVLAPRYVYAASIPFAVLAAVAFAETAQLLGRLTPAAPAALAVVALGVLGLHSWQTWQQNDAFATEADAWRTLVEGIDERYPDLPDGSRVFVRGGPVTQPLAQFAALPAVGETLWGGVELFTVPEGTTEFCERPGGRLYVVDYADGHFVEVAVLPPPVVPPGFEPDRFPPEIPPACPRRVVVP